jgi:hypothetical protein
VEEIPNVNEIVAVDRLRQQLQGLADADVIRLEDGQWLLAALQQVREGLVGQDALAARAGSGALVGRVRALIATGALAPADGQPPIEAATALAALLPSADGTGG